jgi:hypothetical protein
MDVSFWGMELMVALAQDLEVLAGSTPTRVTKTSWFVRRRRLGK